LTDPSPDATVAWHSRKLTQSASLRAGTEMPPPGSVI